MKHVALISILFFTVNTARAVDSFGIGAILGEPTGVSAKFDLDGFHAVDLAAAWSFGNANAFLIHADYLWHKKNLFPIDRRPIDLYFGVGGRLLTHGSGSRRNDTVFGPRFPVGLRHLFADPPIEIFFEVAVILNLIPSTYADGNVGIGARFFF
jgi:hypothetical protein